jgi:hypothetical protein
MIFRAELAEAWRKNSKAIETGDRQLYIELDELKAFKVSSEVKLAQSVMIENSCAKTSNNYRHRSHWSMQN